MRAARVAVVEDERVVAYHLSQQLKRMGYTIAFMASSGKQVLERMAEQQPDVILMDISIDGDMDGIETVSRFAPDSMIPVIYLTAYSEEETLSRARQTKPFGYLLKPFSERELHATIQMAMERKDVEISLRESREHLNLALDAAGMSPWEFSLQERRLRISGADRIELSALAENDDGDLDIQAVMHMVPREDRRMLHTNFLGDTAADKVAGLDFRRRTQDGKVQWLRAQGRRRRSEGMGDKIVGVIRDVTATKAEEERRRQAATIFEATREGLLILDKDFRVVTANPGYQEMTGYSEEDLLGKRPAVLDSLAVDEDTQVRIVDSLLETGQWRGDLHTRGKDGGVIYLFANIIALKSEAGQAAHYVVACSDLTAIRKAEKDLQYLAHFDRLTGLPNRALATDRLEHAITRCRRERHKLALLFIDLDDFKRINDTLGHRAGDEVLKLAAERMRKQIRNMDTVARFAGDEFMVILERIDEVENAAAVARKLIGALAKPMLIEGRNISIGASIGIGIYPSDGQDQDTLIQAADTAMYAAKNAGRNGFTFYSAQMTEQVRNVMLREQELREALRSNQLRLHFQPQIRLSDTAIEGVEALIRWQHPEKGLLAAGDVIPIAERSELIVDIGEWVLMEACRQIAEWQAMGLPRFRVAVNASAVQMRDGRLLRAIDAAIKTHGIAPGILEIEITESVSQDDPDSIATLIALQRMGVSVSIDDFGVGYSCLSSLKKLPIQRLKIDRAFIKGLPEDRNDVMIAETIIAIAHRLNLDVVAEGIETAEQADFLRRNNCEVAQGFHYSRPLPADAVVAFVRNWPGGVAS